VNGNPTGGAMLNPHLRLMRDAPLQMDDSAKNRVDYFRLLFEEAPAACVVTDSACLVIDANRAAERILLQPLSGMLDKPFQRMIAVSDQPTFEKIVSDLLLSIFNVSRPLCMKPRTGAEVDVLFKASMIRNNDGDPQFISWIFLESLASDPRDLL
jgi:PAS domain S-box-containing protein